MLYLLAALVGLIQVFGTFAQESCPVLGDLPVPPPGCNWVVEQDWRGCRIYVRDCTSRYSRCSAVNEVFWKCSSKCEPTCFNRNPTCDKSCGPPRCQCVGGYYRDTLGRCVNSFQCPAVLPPRCNVNEYYATCSTLCEPTCSNMNPVCPAMCGPPKCQCAVGFVRNSDGICVSRGACQPSTPSCPPNEEYMECSSACEPNCYTPQNAPCPLSCGPPKCQCKRGFVRSMQGCIPRHQCFSPRYKRQIWQRPTPSCPPNEEYKQCSSQCEPNCNTPPNAPCVMSCGPPKCQCKPGFVRTSQGCVSRNQCYRPPPSPSCPPNEEYKQCSSQCEPDCYTRPNAPCPLSCGPPKCQCKQGFVRTLHGCIPKHQCFPPRQPRQLIIQQMATI